MKRALLTSVAAFALAAGTTVALSQGQGGGAAGQGAGGNTPMANPSAPSGGQDTPGTVKQKGAQDRAIPEKQKSTQQAPNGKGATTGQAQEEKGAPATKQSQEKGGQEEFGPYELVENWPQPLQDGPDGVTHDGWTWGSVGAVYAETPDRIWIAQRGELPLAYRIEGKYRRQPLKASGRTGNVLQLNAAGQPPFPIEIEAAAGHTRLKASGSVAELEQLDGIDARFEIKGQTLGDLYPLLGLALPQTSPYSLSGDLRKRAKLWEVNALKGRLGLSDIRGDMRFDQAPKVPHLSGDLHSAVLDMDDLGPLIGLPPTARSAKAVEGVEAPPSVEQVRRARGPTARVLPTATLDFERLRAMDADVKYVADRIKNVRDVPLDRGNVQVKLADRVLTLAPLDLGVAGGKVTGTVRIDARQDPADVRATLDVRALQLNRLIPKVETLKTSFSNLDGRLNLAGRGNSVASWLGSASGDVAAITGHGRFSNLLLEFMGLDGAEVVKFLLRGDNNVELRCAAVAFDVDKGNMVGRSLVFDTDDTVFYATGHANLRDESLDFVVRPEPKDMSILSLRGPLVIKGHFGAPKAGVEVVPLAGRGIAALALGAVNPLLALLATIETGPGKDADCRAALERAKQPAAAAAAKGAATAKAARP